MSLFLGATAIGEFGSTTGVSDGIFFNSILIGFVGGSICITGFGFYILIGFDKGLDINESVLLDL